jgi:hypothetical protein
VTANRVVLAALGFGAMTSGVGSALMLAPEKALAQAGCPGTGFPLCKETKKCKAQDSAGNCAVWVYTYTYWALT